MTASQYRRLLQRLEASHVTIGFSECCKTRDASHWHNTLQEMFEAFCAPSAHRDRFDNVIKRRIKLTSWIIPTSWTLYANTT